MPTEKQQRTSLTVVQKILELMTAAFSLAAALAWNDAIQALFARVFGASDGIAAKFFYALIITAIVVVIAIRLSRVSHVIEERFTKKDS